MNKISPARNCHAYTTLKLIVLCTNAQINFHSPNMCREKIISIVKPTRCTNVSNLFYFGMTLYMFWTVFLSIIKSSWLYIQQQAFVKQILVPASSGVQDCTYSNRHLSNRYGCPLASKQQAFVKQILLPASSGVQDCTYSNRHLSMGFCCLLASKQTAVSVQQMPVAVCTVLNSWWQMKRPSETCRVSFQNKINLIHWRI